MEYAVVMVEGGFGDLIPAFQVEEVAVALSGNCAKVDINRFLTERLFGLHTQLVPFAQQVCSAEGIILRIVVNVYVPCKTDLVHPLLMSTGGHTGSIKNEVSGPDSVVNFREPVVLHYLPHSYISHAMEEEAHLAIAHVLLLL